MRLKSFYAKTMTEAMQMVRDTLGDDAVIVASREERDGNIHVTAAVEPSFEIAGAAEKGLAAAGDDWLQYDDEDEESAVAEELTEAMLRHGVAEDVMDNIISCATVVGLEEPDHALTSSLEHLFDFKPLSERAIKRPQMVIGMPGSGKTLGVAKMAARGAMNGLNVGVISCDTIRAGGVEQLKAFTDLLHIKLHRADDPKMLADALQACAGMDQILIDTPGVNPFDKSDLRMLAKLAGIADMQLHMVMQAGGDTEESTEIARVFSTLGARSILPTRLDIARRYGGLLGAAHHGKLSFADASNTPKVADGLSAMTPRRLARMLMPRAFKLNQSQSGTQNSSRGGNTSRSTASTSPTRRH